MVIFEDAVCGACAALHDDILSLLSIRELMDRMIVLPQETGSDASIVGVAGRTTTPVHWVQELALTYRSGIVLFDRGRELFRIDANRHMFYSQQTLRYVIERQWRHYERYSDWTNADRRAILDSGRDVDVRK